MHAFTVNYLKQDGRKSRWQLVNLGFFVHSLPRLMLWCRMFGHKPVVDGTEPTRSGGYVGQAYMWVVCDRCGVRGAPQGSLDPNRYQIGQRYYGPWDDRDIEELTAEAHAFKRGEQVRPLLGRPGRIERHPTGEVGGQLVVGGGFPGWGCEFKVGNGGSEHTLAWGIRLGRLGALYLHTACFGTGLQRRLNPVGYQSKVTGIALGGGQGIEWKLWAARDDSRPVYPVTATWAALMRMVGKGTPRRSRRGDMQVGPWWRHGAVRFNVLDNVLGRKLYSYTPVPGGEVARLVRMPEGDYLVNLKLQRCTRGREYGLTERVQPWSVQWTALARGIPTKPGDRGQILSSGVQVSHSSVLAGTWAAEAAVAIASQMTGMRTRHEWEPTGRVRVDIESVANA